jgi:UDP-4-amino-4-deoxy-L-arabinose formyltransferase/UDP-glucuronic acid dehydrogenase (UDP-4-keto-hexauronic acid decarboxylating)
VFKRIILFGDDFGVSQLLKFVPIKKIKALVCASIRPQYIEELSSIAQELNIPLLIQPRHKSEAYEAFKNDLALLKPDLLLCNSYSMIIRTDVRHIFNENCINIHWSLLPKNRGPNPIQWALIKGEKETGVTIHYMDEGIDTGDVIAQQTISIDEKDTWVSLKDRLITVSSELIEHTLPIILLSQNTRVQQNEQLSSTNVRLDAKYPKIDFSTMSNLTIYNLIRAQIKPLKGAYIERYNEIVYLDTMVSLEEIKQLRETYGK